MKKIKLFPLKHNKYYPQHQTVSTLNPFIIHPIIFIKSFLALRITHLVLCSHILTTPLTRRQNSHTAKKSAFCRWYLLIGRLCRQEKGGSHWWRRALKPPTELPSNMPLCGVLFICFMYVLTYSTSSVHHQRVTTTILCCNGTRP